MLQSSSSEFTLGQSVLHLPCILWAVISLTRHRAGMREKESKSSRSANGFPIIYFAEENLYDDQVFSKLYLYLEAFYRNGTVGSIHTKLPLNRNEEAYSAGSS